MRPSRSILILLTAVAICTIAFFSKKYVLDGGPGAGGTRSEASTDQVEGIPGVGEDGSVLSALNKTRVDYQALFDGLTAENALETIQKIAKNEREWPRRKGAFYRKWGEIDGFAAAAHAVKNSEHSGVVGRVLEGWAKTNPTAAKGWFTGQGANGDRPTRFKGLVTGMSKEAVIGSKQWVRKLATDPDGPMIASQFVLKLMAHENPGETLEWIDAELGDASKAEALQTLFVGWAKHDPTAASDHLASLEKGVVRDVVTSAFTRAIAMEDAESGLEWAKTIEDDLLREQVLGVLEKAVRSGQTAFGGLPLPPR